MIYLLKAQRIGGYDLPAQAIISGLAPNQEAALLQGGDAAPLSSIPGGVVPVFWSAAANGLIKPNGSRVATGHVLSKSAAYATIRNVSFPTYSDFDGRSFRQIWQAPYTGAVLVRGVYETDSVSGGTITNTAFAAGRAIANDNPIDASGAAASWTLTGATTLSAASASFSTDGVYGVGKTGYVLLDLPAPTDGPGGGYVYQTTIASAAPRRGIVGNASRPTSDWENTVNGLLTSQKYRAFYNGGGDNTTTAQNSFTNASGPSYFNVCAAIDVVPLAQCLSGAFFGDSTIQGFGDGSPSVQPNSYSYVHAACKLLRDQGVPLITANYGMEGKNQGFYLSRLTALLADPDWSPSFVVIQPFSSNAPGFTTGNINAGITSCLNLAPQLRRRGIRPIYVTVLPTGSTDSTADGARKVGNAMIRNSGESVLDVSALLGNGASPERIVSAYSADGVHPNRVGNDLIAPVLAAMLLPGFGA